MRQVQTDILDSISRRLAIHPVSTKVSDDGLAYFTTADKQTSIALQVGTKSRGCPLLDTSPTLVFCTARKL